MRRFDHFAVVDWSGAKGERLPGIAISLLGQGDAVPKLINPMRSWSRGDVLEWLLADLPNNTLVGFDLSPGLPFEDCGSYFPGWMGAPRDAKSLWAFVDQLSDQDRHYAVTSFVSHPEARRHFRHGKGNCGDLFSGGSGRLRRTEVRQKEHRLSPSSCFNLVGAAQVGKSSLTGMRVLQRANAHLPVWPFDDLPETGSAIVEIYTSLAAREAGLPPGRSKMRDSSSLQQAFDQLGLPRHMPLDRYTDHATDALLTAAWLRLASERSELWNPEGLNDVRYTEGWTFGVR